MLFLCFLCFDPFMLFLLFMFIPICYFYVPLEFKWDGRGAQTTIGSTNGLSASKSFCAFIDIVRLLLSALLCLVVQSDDNAANVTVLTKSLLGRATCSIVLMTPGDVMVERALEAAPFRASQKLALAPATSMVRRNTLIVWKYRNTCIVSIFLHLQATQPDFKLILSACVQILNSAENKCMRDKLNHILQ